MSSDGGTKTVVLTMSGNPTQDNTSIACASTAIYNEAAEACVQGATATTVGTADSTAPTIAATRPMGNNAVEIEFSEAVDSTTAETIGNFTLSTAATDDVTISRVFRQPWDPKIIRVEADGAIIDAAVGGSDTITTSASVTDVFGNANTTTSAQTITFSDDGANMAPHLEGAYLSDDTPDASHDRITLVFSKNMDSTAALHGTYYTISGYGTDQAIGGSSGAADCTLTGVDASSGTPFNNADISVSTNTITIDVLNSQCDFVAGDFDPENWDPTLVFDNIRVGTEFNGGGPKDVDGNIQMSDWNVPLEKDDAPVVTGLGVDSGATKRVIINFDKNIDTDTVLAAGFTVTTTAGGDTPTVTTAALDWDGRSVILVMHASTDFSSGGSVVISQAGAEAAQAVKDVLGGVIAATGGTDNGDNVTFTLDATQPTISKIQAVDTNSNNLLETGETVVLTFSEEMDKFSAWDQWAFNVLFGPTCAVTVPTSTQAGCQWGYWGDGATSAWTADGGTSNAIFTITLGTAPNVKSGYKIVPWVDASGVGGVADAAGNKVSNIGTISLGSATITSVNYTDLGGGGITTADTVEVVFSKSMDTSTVTSGNVNTTMDLANSHTYGSSPTVAWTTTTNANDTLTITADTGVDMANLDTIDPTSAVIATNGNAVSGTGLLKTSGPTVTSIDGLTVLKLVFTESVLNTNGLEYPGQTSTVTTYAGSPVNLTDGTDDATQLQTQFTFAGGPTATALNYVSADGATVVLTLSATAEADDTLDVTSVVGISGLNATNTGSAALVADYSATLAAGTAPKVQRIEIMKMGGFGAGTGPTGSVSAVNPGDIVRVVFTESMNPGALTTSNIDTALRLCPAGSLTSSDNCAGNHSWGGATSGLEIRWFTEANLNDVVEISPGFDQTIANGDVLDPAATFTSETGLAITAVGGTPATPAAGSTGTIDASSAQVLAVTYTDGDSNGVDAGDVVSFVFNRTMDTSRESGHPSADGCTTALDANILESFTGSPSYQGFFVDSTTGGTWTQRANPWGTSPIIQWEKTTKDCDTLEITLGSSPTVTGGATPDNIWIDGGLIQAAGGVFIDMFEPLFIDSTGPTLTSVAVVNDTGTAGSADATDEIVFVFSESITQSTIATGSVNTVLDSNIAGTSDYGTSPTVTWIAPNMVKVTLGASPAAITYGTHAVNPTTAVTDLAGLPDATASAVIITLSAVTPVGTVTLSDPDATLPGIDKNDISVAWTDSGATTGQYYNVYILPNTVPLDTSTQYPINSSPVAATTGTSAYTYAATSSTYAIYDDSRFEYLVEGVPPSGNVAFYPIFPDSTYNAYVVVCDDSSAKCGTGTESLATASTATGLTGEFKAFDASFLDDLQGFATAGAIFGGPILAGGDFWVEGTLPFMGAQDIPTNLKFIGIKFSAPIDESTMVAANIYLFNLTDDPSAASPVTATLSNDSSHNAVTLTPAAALTASKKYRLVVTRDVKNSFGVPIMGMPTPGSATPGSFLTDFDTGTGADSIGAQVLDNKVQAEGLTTLAVSAMIPEMSVRFNEDMDPTTFTTNSVLLQYDDTADDAFVAAQTPLTTVSGTVDYDPFSRVATIWFNSFLPEDKDFRLQLQATTVKDLAGNYLDGDFDGSAGGNYTATFSTASDTVTTAPQLTWAESDGFHVGVGMDSPMKKTTVTTASNWTLADSTGVSVSLSGANIFFDSYDSSVHFDGLSLTSGSSYTVTAGSNVKGLNNAVVDSTANSQTFTVHDFVGAGATGCTEGTFKFGCGTNDVFHPDVMMFMPIDVWPMNNFANQTSRYNVRFPVTQAIPLGGKIELEFPIGFDIASAAQADAATESYFNADINGPGTGTVTIGAVAVNSSTRKVTLTTAGAATQANDYIEFELKNIVNGAASEVNWISNTGGHTISISSKTSAGQSIEGPLTSMPFPIEKGGSGIISGKITKSDGTTGIASAKIWLSTSRGGGFEKTSGSDGSFTFTGLPLPTTTGTANDTLTYWVNVEPPQSAGYLAGSSSEILLSDETTSVTGRVIKIKQGSSTVSGKFSYNSALLNGDKIRVWASGPDGWLEYDFTLNGKTAGDDGAATCTGQAAAANIDACTNYSMTISDGEWNIGVEPFHAMNAGFSSGPPPAPEFMPPSPQFISVTSTGTANFTLGSADKSITGSVVDQSGNGLSGVQVWAYDPSGTNGFGAGTETGTDGTYTLNVVAGVYKVGAGLPGLPGLSEKQVTVPASGSNTPDASTVFTFQKSDKSVKGVVLDELDNPIQYAGVGAYNSTTGEFIPGGTNAQGYYTLFVPEGTWQIDVHAPGYGRIKANPESGSTAAGDDSVDGFTYSITVASAASDNSGYNFKAGAGGGSFRSISGTITDSNGNGVSNTMVWADEVTAAGVPTGNGNGTQTDSDGNYTLKVPSNCTGGTNSSCTTSYELEAHVKSVGQLPEKTGLKLAATGADLADQDWALSATKSTTINFYAGSVAVENLLTVEEAFVDVFNQSSEIGNHARIENANTGTISLQEGSYDVRAYVQGYGEAAVDSSSLTSGTFTVSGNSTKNINFVLSANTITISGTATGITNAWVHVFNRDTGLGNGTEITASDSGVFSVTVPTPTTGTYELVVDAPEYSSFKQSSISTTTAGITATLTAATSSITGTVLKSDAATLADNAFVWAEEVGGDGFATAPVGEDGTYTLSVEESKAYNVFGTLKDGTKGSLPNIEAGSTAQSLTLDQTIPAASLATNATPKVDTVVPQNGSVIDDKSNNDISLNIEPQDLGDSQSSYSVNIESTPVLHETETAAPLGKEVDIDILNDSGKSLGLLNNTIDLEYEITKSDMTTVISEDASVATTTVGDKLDKVEMGYWDETKGNGTWVTSPTSRKVEVKEDADDAFTVVDYDTFITNLQSAVDNADNDAGAADTYSDHYADYKITMTTSTKHLTTWGPIIQGASDVTAPSAPSGVDTTTVDYNDVSLSWTASTDETAMHATQPYLIYRGSVTSFTVAQSTLLGNSATTTYTDATAGSGGYTWYYRVRGQDAEGNQSTASSELSVTFTPPGSAAAPGGGMSNNTSLDTDPADTDDDTTPVTTDMTDTALEITPVLLDENIVKVKADAEVIAMQTIGGIIANVLGTRDLEAETSFEKSVVNKIVATVESVSTELKERLVAFVTYGTPTTLSLGAGERGGVVNSFKEAFGKLPESQADWEDVVKIGNGRWPGQTNPDKETAAEKDFKTIYKRSADRANPNDDAAVVVMSYGLRPRDRNLDSERAAIKSFRAIFGDSPSTATDWDTVRAIAYSGATR